MSIARKDVSSLEKADALEDRLIEFAVRIGEVAEALPKTRFAKHVGAQIVRSGTSPAPNYGEACGAESREDFIHKMAVVFKELRETRVWLKMIIKARILPTPRLEAVLDECSQLCNIVGSSLKTARQRKTG